MTDRDQDEQFLIESKSVAFPKLTERQLALLEPLGERRGSGANFKKVRRADPGALGERESLACQIGPKFKLCTRTR